MVHPTPGFYRESPMANQIEICNSALIKIGADVINALSDDTKGANLCKTSFSNCRKIVLRAHPWNCATKRVVLSPLVGAPAFDYAYRFQLPSDFVRFLTINPDGDDDYRIEGTLLLADTDTIQLKYISDGVLDEELDDLCAEAVACYLAWHISYAITQSNKVKTDMWESYIGALRMAKSADAQEHPTVEFDVDVWLESRDTDQPGPLRSNR